MAHLGKANRLFEELANARTPAEMNRLMDEVMKEATRVAGINLERERRGLPVPKPRPPKPAPKAAPKPAPRPAPKAAPKPAPRPAPRRAAAAAAAAAAEPEAAPRRAAPRRAAGHDLLEIEATQRSHNKKFNLFKDSFRVSVAGERIDGVLARNSGDLLRRNLVDRLFREVLNQVVLRSGASPDSQVQIVFSTVGSVEHVSSGNVLLRDDPVKKVLEAVERILNSNQEIPLDELKITVDVLAPHRGAGRVAAVDITQRLAVKQCVGTAPGPDGLCLPLALAFLLAKEEFKDQRISKSEWDALRRNRRSTLERRARKLVLESGLRLPGAEPTGDEVAQALAEGAGQLPPAGGMAVTDVAAFAQHLNRRIVVVDFETIHLGSRDLLVDANPTAPGTPLCLFLKDSHYQYVTSMAALYGYDGYCWTCLMPLSCPRDHRCKTGKKDFCKRCQSSECQTVPNSWRTCTSCNLEFRNSECARIHLENGTCQRRRLCENCNALVVAGKSRHECWTRDCATCGVRHDTRAAHECFMQPSGVKLGENRVRIYYDFESMQETGCHIVNFAHARYSHGPLAEQHPNGISFSGGDVIGDFCRWLFQKQHKSMLAIAHYAKGFDAHFVVRWLLYNARTPKVTYTGQKIMQAVCPHDIVLRDSINFIATSLSKLPKAVFQKDEIKRLNIVKGSFPHLFNTEENQGYEGPVPDFKYFGPNGMTADARDTLFAWWKKRRADPTPWNLQRELAAYCVDDVRVLALCMERFRESFIETAGLDPLEYCTIASAVVNCYSARFMPQNTLAIIAPIAPRTRSREEDAFVDDINAARAAAGQPLLKRGVSLMVGGRLVFPDAFDEETHTVYEYHGCFFHGCPKCHPNREEVNPQSEGGKTMEQLYRATRARTLALRNAGYKVRETWSHEWLASAGGEEYLALIAENPHAYRRIDPRDAFFGGRVECFQSQFDATPDLSEFAVYQDVTSLYPTVQYYDPMPVGHGDEYRWRKTPEEFVEALRAGWFGVACVTVVPPPDLHIPVLPAKTQLEGDQAEKLLFDLTPKTGTWTSMELALACEMGYRITAVNTVREFAQSTACFKPFVEAFLKVKQEASYDGEPDLASRQAYADDYHAKSGIQLDVDRLERNEGRRAVAKLCLNSLWGKFGQKMEREHTLTVRTPAEMRKLLDDPTKRVKRFQLFGDDVMEFHYENTAGTVQASKFSNLFVALFTTSHARCRLYNLMRGLDGRGLHRVLYCDTDSLIYKVGPGENVLPTGKMLGELTDELDGNLITEFQSSGPKSYSYRTCTPGGEFAGECLKIKGFSLKRLDVAKRLNYGSAKAVMRGANPEGVATPSTQFVLQRDRTIKVRKGAKVYAPVRPKRVFSDDGSSRPYTE